MITIVGCNKGGAGKSTTSINIAVGLAMQGLDVVLVDADRQRSASKWCAEREEAGHQPQVTLVEKVDNISQTLKSLDRKYDHVIVDVAGKNGRELITGAAVADLIIAPHQSSQLDLDTLCELNEQVIKIKDLNPDLIVSVYHSIASTHYRVKEKQREDIKGYVSEFPELELLKSIGFNRQVYIDVISEGLSVLETSDLNAKEEIYNLINEVYSND